VLDVADVAEYLLERRLVSPRAVVDGRLKVVDASRLNSVFLVTAERERSYVVKLAATAGDPGVAHEAATLDRLAGTAVARWLPAVAAYDATGGVLVLEAASGARDLVAQHRRRRYSVALAREAGRALGELHRLDPTALEGLPTSVASRSGVHRVDLGTLQTSSATALELISLVQRSGELCARLDELEAARVEHAVVHGDVRWDNCLAVPRSGRWADLVMIDWELAGAGDPADDVGAFLGEYLGAWLRSMPGLDPHGRAVMPPAAAATLQRMHLALRAFWDAYVSRSEIDAGRTLRRATQFAAARLLTAAVEEAQQLPDVRAGSLNAIHLAHAVLRRPDEAAAQLLGLWTAA
jgi:aminoglycoside phosphotransferase (APT) family kinase protein